jgi:hypothetical protein
MNRNEQKCENCRYYLAAPVSLIAALNAPAPSVCRRNPPQVFVARIQRDDNGNVIGNEQISVVPIVNPGHWCGEWTAEPETLQ